MDLWVGKKDPISDELALREMGVVTIGFLLLVYEKKLVLYYLKRAVSWLTHHG